MNQDSQSLLPRFGEIGHIVDIANYHLDPTKSITNPDPTWEPLAGTSIITWVDRIISIPWNEYTYFGGSIEFGENLMNNFVRNDNSIMKQFQSECLVAVIHGLYRSYYPSVTGKVLSSFMLSYSTRSRRQNITNVAQYFFIQAK
ncbi:8541_t:CDS:2 [Funneliformis caledonium]|uniref:8541_t:CDS:1 n=1 Tax=Funneliformis caledonium TaxID=1117310 RepID=A0A9N8YKK6_9GLOM|nr:8541_t:CDS:2 [Funneliformis caledonium]